MKCLKTWGIAIILLGAYSVMHGQPVTSVPENPHIKEQITVRFDITQCTRKDLLNYTGDVYLHTGVLLSESVNNSDWKHVVTTWGDNNPKYKLTRISSNIYEYEISPDATTYYGIEGNDIVTHLAFVLRGEAGQTEDLFIEIFDAGLSINIVHPEKDIIVTSGTDIVINAETIVNETDPADSIMLYIDNVLIHISKNDTLQYTLSASGEGMHWIKLIATNSQGAVMDSVFYFIRKELTIADMPSSTKDGINYINDSTVALGLHAPGKESVFVIGSFNDWELNNNFLMNKTTDGRKWWINIEGLNPGQEYVYQYLIDGNIRVADPYSTKILDPVNDKWIPENTYPNLIEYPDDKTSNIAGVLQTGQEEYVWESTEYTPPDITDLVIYELHVQNFTEEGNIKALKDTLGYLEQLGINAIELMPVNEFEGNLSWGYNPSFYFAFDKIYGTSNDFKEFVDECHLRGIAVIIDMVLNHSYSQSPLVQMYWNGSNVTANNPWYNVSCPHSNWCWGYDFNHTSSATKYFVDRVVKYWLTEYNIDGYRFDFTKGFTNKYDPDAWGPDPSRIAILKRIADSVWSVKQDAYVILEHLAEPSEEKELSDYGLMLWGNMNQRYNEATMGYNSAGKSDLTWGYYPERGWELPNLVTYMESHDEERLMYKNLKYGNSSTEQGEYNIKDLQTALQRIELAAAFFFTIPGPKMIWEWGELGYDYSINTCIDGSVQENCRLDLKPVRWDYYDSIHRFRLYKVYEHLIKLKTENNVFKTSEVDHDLSRAVKKLNLSSEDINVTVLGNFDVEEQYVIPNFQHPGVWYSYLTGRSLEVSDTEMPIKLSPGEYHVYTDKKLEVGSLPLSDTTISNENFIIFPNPTTNGNVINLEYLILSPEFINLSIYNRVGQIVFSVKLNLQEEGVKTINIPNVLNKGMYIYRITTTNSDITGKLVVI